MLTGASCRFYRFGECATVLVLNHFKPGNVPSSQCLLSLHSSTPAFYRHARALWDKNLSVLVAQPLDLYITFHFPRIKIP